MSKTVGYVVGSQNVVLARRRGWRGRMTTDGGEGEDSLDLRDAGLGNHLVAAVVLAVADQAAALKQSVSRLTKTLVTVRTHITARGTLLLRWWCCTTCVASGSAAARCEFGSELQ